MMLLRNAMSLVAWAAVLWFGPVAPAADKPTPPSPKSVRLLTVGNSFSNNAMTYLEELVEAGGHRLVLGKAVIGGSSFDKHLDKALLHERDPQDKNGLYSTGKSLKQYLTDEPWDFITIQQASIKSHDAATYRPHAAGLYEYVKKYAPQAEVIIHQTWAYRVDDPRFRDEDPAEGQPRTQREMYEGLTRSYDAIAGELGGLRVVPVGDAFFAVDTDEEWGFRPDAKFDPKQAVSPARPDQAHSLHVGWTWSDANGKRSLRYDGHHANTAGQYLGGCVFYEFLYGDGVVGNKYRPSTVDARFARFLQETAHAAVAARQTAQTP